jgi:molybdopterin converting factor small subunit
LEYTVEQTLHATLEPSCSAAFGIEVGGMEGVAYCAELRKAAAKKANKKNLQATVDEIRKTIAENFEVRACLRVCIGVVVLEEVIIASRTPFSAAH